MKSFGQRLKSERLKRAITLEQISTSTKIGTRMLQALEEENFDQLPGGIFNKGFVRAYARYVGLDEEQAVADYLEASGQNQTASDPVPVAEEPEPLIPTRRMPLGWAAAGILLVAVTLALWSRWRHRHEAESPATAAVQAEATSPAPAAKSPEVVAPKPDSPPTITPTKTTVTPATSLTQAGPTNPQPVAAPGEFTVVIKAEEESWASFQIDDKPAAEDTLYADSQRTLHARNQLVIKVGNAGGVDFVFNGKKLPSQGDYGEVKTITFGPSGIQTKAGTPPPSR